MDNLQQIRRLISVIVYGAISLIIALIIVRVLLLMIGANPESQFVIFIMSSSDTFIQMFEGIYPNIEMNQGKLVLEVFSLVALLFYFSLAFLIQKSIRSVIETEIVQLISNVVDSTFKFLEFILIARFIFKLTGASISSQFVQGIYQISNIIYEPFTGILPGFHIPSFNITFETSTLIAIIAIIIFDSVSEGIILQLRKVDQMGKSSPKQAKPVPTPAPIQQQPQQITINVPQQPTQPLMPPTIIQPQYVQPPTQYIDRRTVQVISPQPQPAYPYQYQNQMETNRPLQTQQLSYNGYIVPPNTRPVAPRDTNN